MENQSKFMLPMNDRFLKLVSSIRLLAYFINNFIKCFSNKIIFYWKILKKEKELHFRRFDGRIYVPNFLSKFRFPEIESRCNYP